MIEVQGLTKRYGALAAVDDISFSLEKGEVVGFLGPNGAGKTTTMRILTGYLPATRGSAKICGLDVVQDSLEVRRRIGYLPEAVPLYPELRVVEMLRFQARLHRLPRAETRRRIPEVLERVGIADRQRSLVGSLSRGLRQRAGLAVALLPSPEVLILDEPTSGLDPIQRIEVRGLIRELAEERTVLLSSHILPEVEAVSPRVIILHRGRIAADGNREELVRTLGGASFVRLEAVVGPDAEGAARLLASIAGVERVDDRGKLGIHHQFDVHAEGDLREDVGALAAAKGWALRELSWQRPTLEQLFSRIALDLDQPGGAAALSSTGEAPPSTGEARAGAASPAVEVASEWLQAGASQAGAADLRRAGAAEKAGASDSIYSLNPFDRGASRDLSAPVERSADEEPEEDGA